METAYFREFILLNDKKSFQATASELGISASSLTRHIQALEQDTGELLLVRNTHFLELTDAGRVFLRYARSIVGTEQLLLNDIRERNNDAGRNLSIGVPISHNEDAFEEFLIAFHAAHPDIRVDFNAFPSRKLFMHLGQGDLDLIFAHEFDSDDDSLDYLPFTSDELYIHITERHPLFQQPEIDLSMLKGQQIYMRYNLQSSFARYINQLFHSLSINAEFLDLLGFWPQNSSASLFITAASKIHSITPQRCPKRHWHFWISAEVTVNQKRF